MAAGQGPRYRRVAVRGSGPSGLSAVHALSREKKFETIRIFERRDRIGGTWIYDPEPEPFTSPSAESPSSPKIPSAIPAFASPAPEDKSRRTGIYKGLDSNVGATVMAFTHTPFPNVNSASSVAKYGLNNPTRPYTVVAKYLEDLFAPFLHLITLNTTVEKLEKLGEECEITLRQSGRERQDGKRYDYWWTERFGLEEFQTKYPGRLEHSKAFRNANDHVNKRVLVVGGNVSASDLVIDLYNIVAAPLHLSQRGTNPVLEHVWTLPNVEVQKEIAKLSLENNGTVHFSNGSRVSNIDKIVFATGYKLSYPFLRPKPVTPTNRLAGFYQHIFKIDDPSLAVVRQVRAGLSFRVFEYQAVAVARYFAEITSLPSVKEQQEWEKKRVEYKGDGTLFHEVAPDLKEYFSAVRDIVGSPAEKSDGYELPQWEDRWAEEGFAVLVLKDELVKRLHPAPAELKAKL